MGQRRPQVDVAAGVVVHYPTEALGVYGHQRDGYVLLTLVADCRIVEVVEPEIAPLIPARDVEVPKRNVQVQRVERSPGGQGAAYSAMSSETLTTRPTPAPEPLTDARAAGILRAVVLAIGLLLLARDLDGRYQWNSAMYAHFARNHLTYGLGHTELFCTWGVSAEPPAVPQRYLNHPPLIALWAAAPMSVLGDEEWVGRTVPIAATLGGAWLLMAMLGRLHSTRLALLAGLFYVTLPITAYFGRMLDHVPLVQFFSLLMLRGYLQWAGLYGPDCRRGLGAAWYIIGAVGGIGTGWAVGIMAGLIWLWHLGRTRLSREVGLAVWLGLIPAASLLAVVLHILWAREWDASLFGPLLWTRTLGQQGNEAKPWAEWFAIQWHYLGDNFTAFGIAAALICAVVAAAGRWVRSADSALRQAASVRSPTIPLAITAAQGFIYVVAFRNQSWTHDYWQYLLGPFVAGALAAVVLAIHALLGRYAPRLAGPAAVLLVILPMPAFARSFDRFHQEQQIAPHYLDMFERLTEVVPPRIPVMTSRDWPQFSERFGNYTNRWAVPQIAFYANRPLIHADDLDEVQANEAGCAAFVLEMADDERIFQMARFLMERYETVTVGQHHLIVLFDGPGPGSPQYSD